MKTIKLLLVAFVMAFSFAASCESEEPVTSTGQCNCVKTYYLYYPAMGSGASYIPARYEVVDQEVGQFNCEDETSGYVQANAEQYSHYKIQCD